MTRVNVDEQKRNGLGIIYTAPSSSGEKTHITAYVTREDEWICSCEGYQYQRKCWHIDEAKNKLRESRAKRNLKAPEAGDNVRLP